MTMSDLSVEPTALTVTTTPRLVRIPRDVSAFIRDNQLTRVDGRGTTTRVAAAVMTYAAAAAVGMRADTWWVWAAVWSLQGLVLLGAVAAQHEGIHGLLYGRGALNHLLGAAAGAVLLFPYSVYRHGHLEHHRRTNAEGDTQPTAPYRNLVEYLVLTPASGALFVGMQWWEALRTLAGRPPVWLRSPRHRREVKLNAVFMAGAYALVALATWQQPGLAAAVYWVPVAVCGAFYAVLVTLPEHYGCDPGPAPAFQTTRTTTSNAVMRFFFWGTNFHTAHHLHPGVPAPRLAELHAFIEPRCDYVETSYLKWHARLFVSIVRGDDRTNRT